MAEASFEQARKTFEKFVASAQATADTFEAHNATVRAGDIGSRAIACAEKSVQAARQTVRISSVGTRLERCSQSVSEHAASHYQLRAVHKFDTIREFIGRARGWALL